jgi:hypothetical protein
VYHKIVFTVIRNVPKASDTYEWNVFILHQTKKHSPYLIVIRNVLNASGLFEWNVFTLHQTEKASVFNWGEMRNALPTFVKQAGRVRIPI